MPSTSQVDALERAAGIIGSQSAMSRALNITKAAISQWKDGRVPAEHCPEIERLTNGAVRCEELRPDIPWGVLRQPQAEQGGGQP
jgi:DNA-binding transcriptional regulator YdaS (Cro superfamily)